MSLKFDTILSDIFCEGEKDKLVVKQLNKIGSCLNFQNEALIKIYNMQKIILDKLGENSMKLNDLTLDVENLGELFTKVADEITTQVAALEATIAELSANAGNPEVPQQIVDGLAKLTAIGNALDALNPDKVVAPVAPVAPVEPAPEVAVEPVVAPVAVEVPVEPVVDPAV